jgi:uncharacterized damage-inducible protein DinB
MDKSNFLRYWHNVRQLTVKLIDEFPADSFDFRPAPEIMTVYQLFKHIIQVEIYIREGFLTGNWEVKDTVGSNMFVKELLKERLISENQKTIRLLSELPEGKFLKIRETPLGNVSGEILLLVAIDEEIHHRGNLYTYLRCLGKVPPRMVQNYSEILKETDDVSENQ